MYAEAASSVSDILHFNVSTSYRALCKLISPTSRVSFIKRASVKTFLCTSMSYYLVIGVLITDHQSIQSSQESFNPSVEAQVSCPGSPCPSRPNQTVRHPRQAAP